MEKACESGKIAAQQIIIDYGITSKKIDQLKNGNDFLNLEASTEKYILSLVQVKGLQKTDLIDFITPFFEKRIVLYTGYKINYPTIVRPILVIFGIIILLIIIRLYRHK